MSSNLSFLLSLIFVITMMAYAGDLCQIQTIYSQIDTIAISAGKLISRNWTINDAVIELVEEDGAHIIDLNGKSYHPAEGDAFRFQIWKEYKPLAFNGEGKTLRVNRSVILGYKG